MQFSLYRATRFQIPLFVRCCGFIDDLLHFSLDGFQLFGKLSVEVVKDIFLPSQVVNVFPQLFVLRQQLVECLQFLCINSKEIIQLSFHLHFTVSPKSQVNLQLPQKNNSLFSFYTQWSRGVLYFCLRYQCRVTPETTTPTHLLLTDRFRGGGGSHKEFEMQKKKRNQISNVQ